MTSHASDTIAPWELHLKTLYRRFVAAATDQCFLWVNPVQGDPYAEHPFAETHRIVVPIRHPRFDLQFAPYVLPLNLSKSMDCDILRSSVQIAYEDWTLSNLSVFGGQSIAGWVMADTSAKALANYWANYCHLQRFQNLDKLLRFHDPSVREWLWPTLSLTQQQQLLGPAQQIMAINRQQALMYHTTDHVESHATWKNLTLSTTQWQQLDDYAVLHAAWLACCTEQPTFRSQLLQKSQWQQGVFAALQQATNYGLHDVQDRTLFAKHALQIGSDFHQHSKLTDVWIKTQAGDAYASALDEVFGQAANVLQVIIDNPAS